MDIIPAISISASLSLETPSQIKPYGKKVLANLRVADVRFNRALAKRKVHTASAPPTGNALFFLTLSEPNGYKMCLIMKARAFLEVEGGGSGTHCACARG
jgi:hypothetical protein